MRHKDERTRIALQLVQFLLNFRHMTVSTSGVVWLYVAVNFHKHRFHLERFTCARNAGFGIDDQRVASQGLRLRKWIQPQQRCRDVTARICNVLGVDECSTVDFGKAERRWEKLRRWMLLL